MLNTMEVVYSKSYSIMRSRRIHRSRIRLLGNNLLPFAFADFCPTWNTLYIMFTHTNVTVTEARSSHTQSKTEQLIS